MNHPHRSQQMKMSPDDLLDAISILTDGNQSEFARQVGVDGRTVRRWIAGDLRIPKTAQILIRKMLEDKKIDA